MATNVLNVKIDNEVTKEDILRKIDYLVKLDKHSLIATVNAEFILDAQLDHEFKHILNKSALSIPDGIGVIYAIEYLDRISKTNSSALNKLKTGLLLGFGKNSLPSNRITGRELMFDLCKYASAKGYSVGILGGWAKDNRGRRLLTSGDVAGKAGVVLQNKYENLKIIFATSDFNRTMSDDDKTISYIHSTMEAVGVDKIDILFVGYNHGWQEKWIERNADTIPAKVCIGVGGSIDYIAGNYREVPIFFVKNNLEWLYRLLTQPWRFSRIIKAFPTFPIKIFIQSIK